jgi:streptogramin lyase
MSRHAPRSRTARLAAAASFLFAFAGAAAADDAAPPPRLGPPADKCDLDVTYIQQLPFYPGYAFEYPGNVPTIRDPQSGTDRRERRWFMTRAEADAHGKHHPEPGETITFTAHVINNGGRASPPAEYVFKLDDTVLDRGTLPALAPREETTITTTWPYAAGRHWVGFEVDPDGQIDELSRANNRRRDGTFGFVLTIAAGSEEEYEAFHDTPNMLGTYSFEDWCQAHIDAWREEFRLARYPSTPDGVQAEVRFNGIFRHQTDDPALAAYQAAGGHLNWRIIVPRERILREYASVLDWGLVHELVHQCGVIDSYQIGMTALDNLARDPFTGQTIEIPYADHRRVHHSLMGGAYRDELQGRFSEHEAAAFDATLARWGNHAGYGIYLFDMPKHNIVRFLDNAGQPLAGAQLYIWQQNTTERSNVTSRVMGRIPPKVVRLDDHGEFDLGSNPYDRLWVVGGTCNLMFGVYGVHGQREFHIVDVTEFNLAYWRGDHERHTYVFATNIAPLAAPPAPTGVTVVADASTPDRAVLRWEHAGADVTAFRVRGNWDNRCAIFEAPYDTLVEVPGAARQAEATLHPRAEHTFLVVTAVDAAGRESPVSEHIVWPPLQQVRMGLIRPIGVAFGPDGSKYVVDNHMGGLFRVDAQDSLHNYLDTALIGSGGVNGVVVDSRNRVLCVGRDGRGVIIIDPEQARIVGHFGGAREATDEPGKLYQAFGIAVDGQDRIYVSDTGNQRLQVLTPAGEPLAQYRGAGAQPLAELAGVAVRDQGDGTRVALVVGGERTVRLLDFDAQRGTFSDVGMLTPRNKPISVAYGPDGRLYVGTQAGVDIYDATGARLLAHWQSPHNRLGHQVWGVAVNADGLMICSEGGDNEKRWFFARPDEFAPVE